MTAIARLLAALVVIAIGMFETPTAAIGGTFVVKSCRDAPGDANNAWTSTVMDSVTMEAAATCGQGDQGGLTVAERLGVGPNADAGDEAWWAFTAPSGTRIVKLDAATGALLGKVPGDGFDRLVAVAPW